MRRRTDPNRSRRARRTSPVVVLVVAVVTLLASACGSDDLRGEPEFASGAMPGINQRIGDVLLRDVVIQQPAVGEEIPVGGTARLTLVLLNDGTAPDSLVEVRSPISSSTAFLADRNDDETFEPVDAIRVPPGAGPPIGAEGFPYYIELRGLNSGLRVGESPVVTFTFEKAGDIELGVPVSLPGRATGSPIDGQASGR